jgi:HemY protein
MPELALAAAQRANLLGMQAGEPADENLASTSALALSWLEPVWNTFAELDAAQQHQLVRTMEPGLAQLDGTWLARLEQAQRQQPNNAYLQYLTGQAFMQRQLWGKAAQLLGQASHSLTEPSLLRRTWRSLAALAEERGDAVAAQSAWKKAALLD